METEKTIIDHSNQSNKKLADKSNSLISENALSASAGAVFGSVATMAGQAYANKKLEDEVILPDAEVEESRQIVAENQTEPNTTSSVRVETPNPADSPTPEESIIATATGVRVAHVDDSVSFSHAFADARSQVGPGGVFEWRGRVYGTYYKNEWDNMTPAQKHDYQIAIDYEDVVSEEHRAQFQSHPTHEPYSYSYHNQSANDDVEVQVLRVETTDLNQDGIPENSALLSVNGHEVIIVDVDQNGTADVMIDMNNGQTFDISQNGLTMPNMASGDVYMAQADSNPDYMNDGNVEAFS